MRHLIIFAIIATALAAPMVAKGQTVVHFDEGGTDISLTFGRNDTVKLAAPVKGDFLYHKNGTLYVRLPRMPQLARIAPAIDAYKVPEIRAERVGPGPHIAGYLTEQWKYYVGHTFCGTILGSSTVADVVGYTVTDIANMNVALGLLQTASPEADPCKYYLVPPGLGKMIGFPMASEGRESSSRVKAIKQNGIDVNFKLPADDAVMPFSDKVRRHFQKLNMPSRGEEAFEKTKTRIPEEMQPKALEHLRRAFPE